MPLVLTRNGTGKGGPDRRAASTGRGATSTARASVAVSGITSHMYLEPVASSSLDGGEGVGEEPGCDRVGEEAAGKQH
jgi:hypothetical protein